MMYSLNRSATDSTSISLGNSSAIAFDLQCIISYIQERETPS
jgi:hypothetical protein